MTLFKFATERELAVFYARDPKDIRNLIEHYYKQTIDAGRLDDPNIANWAKRVPEMSEIETVDSGNLWFHVGPYGGGSDWEDLQVTDDFLARISLESIMSFDSYRRRLPEKKRVDLYKFYVPDIAGQLYFIPEDVMQGILDYDLEPHMEKAREAMCKISGVMNQEGRFEKREQGGTKILFLRVFGISRWTRWVV